MNAAPGSAGWRLMIGIFPSGARKEGERMCMNPARMIRSGLVDKTRSARATSYVSRVGSGVVGVGRER